jgi:hypothetical protein
MRSIHSCTSPRRDYRCVRFQINGDSVGNLQAHQSQSSPFLRVDAAQNVKDIAPPDKGDLSTQLRNDEHPPGEAAA